MLLFVFFSDSTFLNKEIISGSLGYSPEYSSYKSAIPSSAFSVTASNMCVESNRGQNPHKFL